MNESRRVFSIMFTADCDLDLAPWFHHEPGEGWACGWLWFAIAWIPGDAE